MDLDNEHSPAWYCLRTQPKRENIAAVHLRKHAGIEVLSPRIRFQRRRLQKKAWTTEALFPGYLFARFDLTERWREIQHAYAVRGLVHFGNRYPVISPAAIEQLRATMGPDELAVLEEAIDPGNKVVIIDGAFAGLETVVTAALPAKERVKVLMNFLGREIEVEIPQSSVLSAK